MVVSCTGKCRSVGYNLYRWHMSGRVKCTKCYRAFDETGQVKCFCCGGKVSRSKNYPNNPDR